MSQLIHRLRLPADRNAEPRRLLVALAHVGAGLAASWRTWQRRARQRRELRDIADEVLRDVGISRAQANYIASKQFWRE